MQTTMDKENSSVISLNTTLNIGHLVFSSISLLVIIITMWVNVNVRLAHLEYEVDAQEEAATELKLTQEKLFLQFSEANSDVTRLLYEIQLKLKDKEDRERR